MNCRECQELLQRRLDGAHVPGSLALDQHLAGCQSCRHAHAAVALMLEGLKVLDPLPQPSASVTERIVTKVLRDRQVRRARVRRRMWVTLGLAAAILIMVWAGNMWLPAQRNLPAPATVGPVRPVEQFRSAPISPGNPVEESAVPLAKSVGEMGRDMLALTNRLADQTKDQARKIVPRIPAFPGETRVPMEEPLAPVTQSLRQAGQGVSEGWHTVSRNAQRFVSYFVNDLPEFGSSN